MYKRIMIVVDDGAIARPAIDEGLALAKVHRAEVLFFHVLPNYVVPMSDMPPMVTLGPEQHRREVERTANRLLATASEQAKALGVRCSTGVGSGVDAAECVARAASDRECHLVVIGSHGRTAIQRLIFGSVVTRLITLAPVPVLVCKPSAKQALQPSKLVLVPKRRRAQVPKAKTTGRTRVKVAAGAR